MYEVISTAVDAIENDEGSLLIFGGRQRAFVVARFTRPWRTCLLFNLYTAKKQMSQTNRSMPDKVCKWPCILSANLSRISYSQV